MTNRIPLVFNAGQTEQLQSGDAIIVPDVDVSFTNNTTGNVSNSAHGFAPKNPNDATKYLDGTGAYSVPAGSGAPVANPVFTGTVQYPIWATGTAYTINKMVQRGYTIYMCTNNHTSGTFMTDCLGGYWIPLGDMPGIVKQWAFTTIPYGYLNCNGSLISIASYTDLYAVLGTNWGSGSGTFGIPDFRGASIAGVGTGTGYTTNEVITAFTKYDDQFQGHQIGATADMEGDQNYWGFTGHRNYSNSQTNAAGCTPVSFGNSAQGDPRMIQPVSNGSQGTPRMGTVTRGKVVGINFIIKAL